METMKGMKAAIKEYRDSLCDGFTSPQRFIKTIGRKYVSICNIEENSKITMILIEDYYETIPYEFMIKSKRDAIEKEAKQFIFAQLRENPWMADYTDDQLEPYICECVWCGDDLYIGIDKLNDSPRVATLKDGLLF